MEFRDVIRHRRMVRSYDESRPVPPDVIDRLVQTGLRAPSAGFSQGWGFLVLGTPEEIACAEAAGNHKVHHSLSVEGVGDKMAP